MIVLFEFGFEKSKIEITGREESEKKEHENLLGYEVSMEKL